MPHFRKKPVVIEAWLYDGCTGNLPYEAGVAITRSIRDGSCFISTLEGEMECRPGDWIIRGVKGEFYPCHPEVFALTYAPAEETSIEPEGWLWVPVEPTHAMLWAADRAPAPAWEMDDPDHPQFVTFAQTRAEWAAMLAAAPPVQDQRPLPAEFLERLQQQADTASGLIECSHEVRSLTSWRIEAVGVLQKLVKIMDTLQGQAS